MDNTWNKAASTTLAPVIVSFLLAPLSAQLPDPGMEISLEHTALVITDPQNDFLSKDGVAWGVVGESVTANNTVENIESLLKVAKEKGMQVFISPHYYYPTDHSWQFEGALEAFMHNVSMFDRKDPLSLEEFEGSGPDWLEPYKPYIQDGETVVTSPHKVFGPQQNDLALQLRKRGINKVILAGMSGNLCVESHMRDLLEEGFEVAIVWDATASAIIPEGNGFEASMTNYRFIANTVWNTEQTVELVKSTERIVENK